MSNTEKTRNLVVLSAQPNDLYFCWQLRVQLHNLRKYNLTSNYTALIWEHTNRLNGETFSADWGKLEEDFPEVTFKFYQDTTSNELDNLIKRFNYIPLLRPWLLGKYFGEYPELKDKTIFYIDSDVILTKEPSFLTPFILDDVCYLSDTQSYIGAKYFDSKIGDVLPDKLEAYKQIDVLDDLLREFGLNRSVAEFNQENSGGAQYLLKNIDANFWEDVFKGCITVRLNLQSINRRFFENEDRGFQSWCADMWSILFNLWKRGIKTACPKEMDFAWATDPIDKWDRVNIYHDAGATRQLVEEDQILFHKREAKYINNQGTPFEDDLSMVSDRYCSYNYVKAIEEAAKAIYKPIILKDLTTGSETIINI